MFAVIVATLTLRELFLIEADVTEHKLSVCVYVHIDVYGEIESLLLVFKLLELDFWQQLYNFIPTKRQLFTNLLTLFYFSNEELKEAL